MVSRGLVESIARECDGRLKRGRCFDAGYGVTNTGETPRRLF